MSWTDSGPVSLPPRPVAYFAGLLLVAAAIVGVGLGFKASWRNGERGGAGLSDQAAGVDAAIPARPLVELPPPPQQEAAANTAAANSADDKDEADDTSIDAQTAAAQEVQSKPSKSSDNIDDILTSSSEKPQAPAKPSTDESAPPGKSDVPF
jgi:hypothetical protein